MEEPALPKRKIYTRLRIDKEYATIEQDRMELGKGRGSAQTYIMPTVSKHTHLLRPRALLILFDLPKYVGGRTVGRIPGRV